MFKVDKSKCVGCGYCASICNAITMVDGKASIKDQTAPCLKEAKERCPVGAIIED